MVGIEPLGVRAGELGDFLIRPATADREVAAVLERQEVRELPLDDAQPMGGEIEIANHLRVQERNRVGGDRVAKTGMEFFRHRGAADHRTALEHDDAEPRHRQIGGADEAVVPAADDRCVVGVGDG